MPIIPIDSLTTGMILKNDVKDRSGRLLLPAGEALTDKHLKIFMTWGVLEADILSDDTNIEDDEQSFDADPVIVENLSNYVKKLFCRNDQNYPPIKELIKICIERKIENAESE